MIPPNCPAGKFIAWDGFEFIIIREELNKFIIEMEKELQRHDLQKGDSWKTMEINELKSLLCWVFSKWRMSIVDVYATPNAQIRAELVDLANVAMMLHNRLGD